MELEPLPEKPKPPKLAELMPRAGMRGKILRLTLRGQHLDKVQEVVVKRPGVQAKLIPATRSADVVQADVIFPADTPGATYDVAVRSPAGDCEIFSPAREPPIDW